MLPDNCFREFLKRKASIFFLIKSGKFKQKEGALLLPCDDDVLEHEMENDKKNERGDFEHPLSLPKMKTQTGGSENCRLQARIKTAFEQANKGRGNREKINNTVIFDDSK